ncbi:MAG: hypothetical protein GW859_08035 [Sphingomonadales bacterium]|nr:hypothetical protein [Sphingomonadales bacterium]
MTADADYYRGPNTAELRQRWLEYHRLCCEFEPAHWPDLNKKQLEIVLECYFRRVEYLERQKLETSHEVDFVLDGIAKIERRLDSGFELQ